MSGPSINDIKHAVFLMLAVEKSVAELKRVMGSIIGNAVKDELEKRKNCPTTPNDLLKRGGI